MNVLRRVEPLSAGKTAAVLYGGLGLVIGALVSVFALVGAGFASASERSPFPMFGAIFGVGAIVLFPLLYGCFGFVGGLLMSALYNLAARVSGGIRIDLR